MNIFSSFSHVFPLRFHIVFHSTFHFFFFPSRWGLCVFFWVGMSFRGLGAACLALRCEVWVASGAIGALGWLWCVRPGNRLAGAFILFLCAHASGCGGVRRDLSNKFKLTEHFSKHVCFVFRPCCHSCRHRIFGNWTNGLWRPDALQTSSTRDYMGGQIDGRTPVNKPERKTSANLNT